MQPPGAARRWWPLAVLVAATLVLGGVSITLNHLTRTRSGAAGVAGSADRSYACTYTSTGDSVAGRDDGLRYCQRAAIDHGRREQLDPVQHEQALRASARLSAVVLAAARATCAAPPGGRLVPRPRRGPGDPPDGPPGDPPDGPPGGPPGAGPGGGPDASPDARPDGPLGGRPDASLDARPDAPPGGRPDAGPAARPGACRGPVPASPGGPVPVPAPPAVPVDEAVRQIRRALLVERYADVIVRVARPVDPAPTGAVVYAVRIDGVCAFGYWLPAGSSGSQVGGPLPGGRCLTD
ncbi:MAG: hypothetical protein V7637_3623 [Mycobacteriales bacterium]